MTAKIFKKNNGNIKRKLQNFKGILKISNYLSIKQQLKEQKLKTFASFKE